ncbi:MOSC domain-containing protein [Bacillus sp. FJAT-42376]|uniref:MOSC domain-containing protein n=1 Tax=Bacillus sp. FJAT-42376 TaxID=2014076 RepID=UPI000F4E0214|nr:MOSC domain-containing protein [Bacillus sp. FJAT-42376]AZB42498.1 MOSC domain-containing protein [Bacillus sp. FJAT-42376]
MRIEYVSKGKPAERIDHKGKPYLSGIHKEQTNHLEVSAERVTGDDVANHTYHGGLDRVLCVYPYEHYTFWEKEFGKPLLKSAFGENLTVSGMKEIDVCIGDQYKIGSVLTEVSQGRYPCVTINRRTGNDQLLSRIIETGYTGYFLRIIEPGTIKPADSIQLAKRVTSITVADIHHTFFHNRSDSESILKILELEPLAADWHRKFEALAERSGKGI